MSRKTDVIVIGSGMAGLVAALAASKENCKTAIICEGMGNLSISGGTIDLMGYDQLGNLLSDPWEGINQLPPEHPYALLGADNIKNALKNVTDCLRQYGLNLKTSQDENGNEINTCLPTIAGTLKPVWMFYENTDALKIKAAKNVLIVGIKGFRDCRPQLIAQQLKRYPEWKDKNFSTLVLPAPFAEKGRSLNALDIAQVVDREKGKKWLYAAIRNKGADYDLALLPPILGAKCDSPSRNEITEIIGCPVIELQCIPPGVGGLRLRSALIKCLEKQDVEFFENAQVISSVIQNGICEEITVHAAGRNMTHSAKAFVIATGGILGGGIILGEGTAKEAITNFELNVPSNVDDWTNPDIFGQHFISSFGVSVDKDLRLVQCDNLVKLDNVFFAGRTIGGYDYASEKSGHGVAVSTGWKAGEMASSFAGCQNAQDELEGETK